MFSHQTSMRMTFSKFEEIESWQKAQDLAVKIYQITATSKDFGYNDQIRRAVISISNNIAEGFNRNTPREFIRFLNYATASCSEVKSMLYLGTRLRKFSVAKVNIMLSECESISKMLYGLINYLKRRL